MKNAWIALVMWVACSSLASARAYAPRGEDFLVGLNQAWVKGHFGWDMRPENLPAFERAFTKARELGAPALRIWLFEGLEGIRFDSTGRLKGVRPEFLEALRGVVRLSHKTGVQIYWTLLDGNPPRGPMAARNQARILRDEGANGRRFLHLVLPPVLDVIASEPSQVFGVDIINEIQGSVRKGVWGKGEEAWKGARAFLSRTSKFLRRYAPGIRLTASAGHHTAVDDLLAGRYAGLGLDFLDVHIYGDTVPARALADLSSYASSKRLPIVLGECGTGPDVASTSKDYPVHQANVLEGWLQMCEALGFSAAFPWMLDDPYDDRHTLTVEGEARPALARIAAFVRSLPALTQWRAKKAEQQRTAPTPPALPNTTSQGMTTRLQGGLSNATSAPPATSTPLPQPAARVPAPSLRSPSASTRRTTLRPSTRLQMNMPLGE